MLEPLNRPVQIQEFTLAVRDLADPELYTTKDHLTRSVAKLHESNAHMAAEIKLLQTQIEEKEQEAEVSLMEDINLYQESIQENVIVVANQEERIECLNHELTTRGLPINGLATDLVPPKMQVVSEPVVSMESPSTNDTSVYL